MGVVSGNGVPMPIVANRHKQPRSLIQSAVSTLGGAGGCQIRNELNTEKKINSVGGVFPNGQKHLTE